MERTNERCVRGIRPGQSVNELKDLLGDPERVDADQQVGNRVLTSYVWTQEHTFEDVTIAERITTSFHEVPPLGLTSFGIEAQLDETFSKTTRDAFKRLKVELLQPFKKGENKSTFRAPGLAHGNLDDGFVAVFYSKPATLILNGGVHV